MINKLDYIGNEYQLYGVRVISLLNGKSNNVKLLEVKNGLGLELEINLDRGFDITSLKFEGVNFSYLSSCGYVNSAYYDNKGDGFLKSFSAGFLTTCGLTQVGSPNTDENEELPLHGTFSNIPVNNYSYYIKNNKIYLKAEILDENIFNYKLQLLRTIEVNLLKNEFKLKDEIINRGDKITPLQILYHMNLGYPFLDENIKLNIPSNKIVPRNEEAEQYISTALKFDEPTKNYLERCYYHYFNKDNVRISAFNPLSNKGLEISYNSNNLKYFTEWKMCGIRDYVLGLEPGNTLPEGRNIMRKRNELEFINPKEVKKFEFKIKLFNKEK